MRFKEKEELEIYRDYHNTKLPIGKVRLIEYLRPGYTFTNDDEKDEKGELIIFCYERWIVEFVDSKYYKKGHKKQHNIRFDFRDIEPDRKIIANYPSERSLSVPDEDRPFDD